MMSTSLDTACCSASLSGLGAVLQDKGDTAGALANRRQGLVLREELARLDPNNGHYRRHLAFSHHNVGLSLVEAGDLASALANYRTELGLFESLSKADPTDVQGRRNRSLAHKQIGDVLMPTGDLRGALAHYRAALELDRGLTSVNPGNAQALLDLSRSEIKVGSVLGKLRRTQDALVLMESGVTRQESLMVRIRITSSSTITWPSAISFLQIAGWTAATQRRRLNTIEKLLPYVLLSEKSPSSDALAECYANLAKVLGPRDHAEAVK